MYFWRRITAKYAVYFISGFVTCQLFISLVQYTTPRRPHDAVVRDLGDKNGDKTRFNSVMKDASQQLRFSSSQKAWNVEKRRKCEQQWQYPTTPNDKVPDEIIEREQKRRQSRLRALCKQQGHRPPKSNHFVRTRHVLVNDARKVMFCFVPKSACSYIGSIVNHGLRKDQWNKYSDDEPDALLFEQKYKKYYRFIFVRDPFSRLLSCYRDKFLNRTDDFYYRRVYGRKIVKSFRSSASDDEIEKGSATFGEFLRYLAPRNDREDTRDDFINCFNDHWSQYHELCEPCEFKYDFIGRFETLATDLNYVIRKAGISNVTEVFEQSRRQRKRKTNPAMIDEFYRDIPGDIIQRVYDEYKWDFEMFNYDCPPFLP
ncbi:carbohydrate sulfotransferase 13-like [Tubulanus polymorphus]|uniref:carbohydrate sulfotransferase 13-like n=1 Tax=Tubulanus polymorphus TaxID=672921 RepID=UPI003DA3DF6C